jgi:hypothetical protein
MPEDFDCPEGKVWNPKTKKCVVPKVGDKVRFNPKTGFDDETGIIEKRNSGGAEIHNPITNRFTFNVPAYAIREIIDELEDDTAIYKKKHHMR